LVRFCPVVYFLLVAILLDPIASPPLIRGAINLLSITGLLDILDQVLVPLRCVQ
jgi:hypothetical protein